MNIKNRPISYKPSDFIVEGPFSDGYPKLNNESITHPDDVVGRSLIGRILATPEMAVKGSLYNMEVYLGYFHELNHYLQDLSITSCITEAELKDRISAVLVVLSDEHSLHYPLMDPENRQHNRKVLNAYGKADLFQMLEELNDAYTFIYKTSHHKPQTAGYSYGGPNEEFFEHFALSYKDLLECYAYIKSYHDLFAYAQTNEEIRKVNQLLNKHNVFPYISEGSSFAVDTNKDAFDKRHPAHYYHTAQLLFMAAMPENWGEIIRYYYEDCPQNFHGSMAETALIKLYLTLEMALNIPDTNFITQQIRAGGAHLEDFSPVHRFYKTLKTIRDNGGFPNAVEGTPFYFTFFNWVASQNGWLSYEETCNRSLGSLAYRINQNHEAITSLQYRVLNKKIHGNPHHFFWPPANVVSMCGLPVISRNANQLELVHVLENFVKESMGVIDMYHSFFGEIRKAEVEKDLEAVIMNGVAMLRETVCRLMSHSVQKMLLRKGFFECPFNPQNCPVHEGRCKHIDETDSVGAHCPLLVLRFSEAKIILDKEHGNTPNCMLRNYMLDYRYNIQNIKETWKRS